MKLDKYSAPSNGIRRQFSKLGGSDFDRMITYLFELDRSMQNQKSILKESHKEELRLFPNAVELTNSVYQEYYNNYDTHFVSLLLNSALVTSYSIFESVFQKVCFFAAESRCIAIKKDHFKGMRITERCKAFIQEEVGMDLSEIEDEWSKLVISQQMRNKIVHHASIIPRGNDQLREHAEINPHLIIEQIPGTDDFAFFITNRNYIYEYLSNSSSYLLYILMRL